MIVQRGCDTSDEQIKLCQKYGVVLDDITLACKPIIHAPLGAKIAKAGYESETTKTCLTR